MSEHPKDAEKRPYEKPVFLDRSLILMPELYNVFSDVSGVLHQTVDSCKVYAEQTADNETAAHLTELKKGFAFAVRSPDKTLVSVVTPQGDKKYPHTVVLRTIEEGVNQAILLVSQKPKDKTMKGVIYVTLGSVKPDKTIEEKTGISLEKIKRVRETSYRRRQIRDTVVLPSCVSINEKGQYKRSTINAYLELGKEFDDLYNAIHEVYEEFFREST